MDDFERLGLFYLGRRFDLESGPSSAPLLYEARDLTTHAVCVGMTGSGKTGLGVALLEEAAIDGVPAIAIDPKGDLTNLLLSFPELSPANFRPWIDEEEASRRAMTPDELAATVAAQWRAGLAAWGQDGARVAKVAQTVDLALYTPGSRVGRQLSLLGSFAPPSAEVLADPELLDELCSGAASGALGLVGIDARPLESREHVLLARLFADAWVSGRTLDLAGLLQAIQKPPFSKIGVLDLDVVFPPKDRTELAMRLNNLLASPGVSAWLEGEPLDVARLLRTPEGKPRLTVLSIAHLSDAARMFFVTRLLGEVLAWSRAQSGTSSLRAILYMDEIAGYFPPVAAPPSKAPMLTLLKQARSSGLGVVLATQNPVDLDYKGLSNAGTWFVGRLQTERDRDRVLDGLEGAATAAGKTLDRASLSRTIGALPGRVFVMNNVHEDGPVVFQTRWTLSYLRGPLTRAQLAVLAKRPDADEAAPAKAGEPSVAAPLPRAARPALPAGVPERFAKANPGDGAMVYQAVALGTATVHYVSAKASVDVWKTMSLLARPTAGGEVVWDEAKMIEGRVERLDAAPLPDVPFGEAPAAAASDARFEKLGKTLASHIYQGRPLTLYRHGPSKLVSRVGESAGDFRARVAHAAREQRDDAVEKLRRKVGPRVAALQEKLARAERRVETEKRQREQQGFDAALSVGASVLGALFSRKTMSLGNLGRTKSAAKSAGRVYKEGQEVAAAEGEVVRVSAQLAALEAEVAAGAAALADAGSAELLELEELRVPARKADTTVEDLAIMWIPVRVVERG